MPLPTPQTILQPFANDAVDPTYINPIPNDDPGIPGRASMELGFPPATMTPKTSGGTPPFGQDMNGILYLLSSHAMAVQAGQPYLFDSSLSAAIGGYPKGIVLGMADQTGLWINQADGNTTDPDGGSAANWQPVFRYGPTTISGLTGGVYTLSAIEAAADLLVFSGVLGSNQQVVVPNSYRKWLVVNATSGSFTLTVKTAAGSGVLVPQGGLAAPTQVYGDSVNVYPAVAPITLPTSVTPTPDSIALRDNVGQLFATLFNSNASNSNPTIDSVGVWTVDGFLRKISMLNFEAQMQLANIAGQLVNAQVPLGVVSQWAATLFTSPAFTGVPTAPTAAAGTATTQLATTAFVNQANSLLANGYAKFSNGLTLQWGFHSFNNNPVTVFFPTAFTSTCFGVQVTPKIASVSLRDKAPVVGVVSAASFTMQDSDGSDGSYWFAIGV